MSDELVVSAAKRAVSGAEGRARIRERSFAYAVRAIKLYEFLQSRRNGVGWVLGRQYLRSASSIGANVEEAQSAESRADFIHKLGVAQKEARESLYWLRASDRVRNYFRHPRSATLAGNRRNHRHHYGDHRQHEGEGSRNSQA